MILKFRLCQIINIKNIIKEKYSSYDAEKSLREEFVEKINKEIEDIQNNNIGNGLGLALAKKIIDLHEGYIEVSSEKDKYTEFTIILRKED